MALQVSCNQKISNLNLGKSEKKTLFVALLTLVTMIIEIVAGLLTGSMALLADGYHMATHAAALFLSFLVYRLYHSESLSLKLNFGTGKILSLGGFASTCLLGVTALWILFESIYRLIQPQKINFQDAILVSVIGLVVNLISLKLLSHQHNHSDSHEHEHGHDQHHGHDHEPKHHHQDSNLKSAIAHVLADLLTSIAALLALGAGVLWGWTWLDALIGILGGVMIWRWAWSLGKTTSLELLDAFPKEIDRESFQKELKDRKCEMVDFHIWKNGPDAYICTLTVRNLGGLNESLLEGWIVEKLKKVHLTLKVIN